MSEAIKATSARIVEELFKPQLSAQISDLVSQPDYSFRDLSYSSLKLVEFCMRVEEALDIEVEFSDLLDNATFLGFSQWLAEQKQAQ